MKSFQEILESTDNLELALSAAKVLRPEEVRCFFDGRDGQPCPVCLGRGWYVVGGTPQRCENYMVQLDTGLQENLTKLSGIGDSTDKTLDNFKVNITSRLHTYSVEEIDSLKTAHMFASRFCEDPRGWLVYEGTYGCGKTHLALGVAQNLIHNHGLHVLFVTGADLLDSIRATFNTKNGEDVQSILGKYQSVPALILDDYGAEKSSEWAEEKLFQLLNHRHAKNSATVITTNLSLDQMPPRIRSRMKESKVVNYIKISAPDYRHVTNKIKEHVKPAPVSPYHDKTFDTWESSTNVIEVAAKNWVSNQDAPPVLYITGPYGSGKTHLAAAIANSLQNGKEAEQVFITARELSQRLHSSISDDTWGSVNDITQSHTDIKYLFLDDLRQSSLSRWSKELVFDIIDQRILNRRSTVITSSDPVKKMDARAPHTVAE